MAYDLQLMPRLALVWTTLLLLLQLGNCFDEAQRSSNGSLLWGPYKPNLYFGVQPKIPKSLSTGLLWARVESFQIQNLFRYNCEQGSATAGYGWEEYDARTGGRHVVYDVENSIDLVTDFAKIEGGDHGGSWGTRVTGKLAHGAPPNVKTTVIFYATLDESVGHLTMENQEDALGYEGPIVLQGSGGGLGDFRLEVTSASKDNQHPTADHPHAENKPLDRTIVQALRLGPDAFWQAKAVVFQEMKKEVDDFVEKYGKEAQPPPWLIFTLPNQIAKPSTMYLVQKVFEGPFEFDILFSSASSGKKLTSDDLTAAIKTTRDQFSPRFDDVFPLQPPFNKAVHKPFARSMFSNLLGGIGYFYGEAVVDRTNSPAYEEDNEGFWEEAQAARAQAQAAPQMEGPFELFSAVPSRPFFPRGFLWDEGFHLLPILDWDVGLTLEILKSWFSRMDEDGWIAREQILGAESRSRVPQEFMTQYPNFANPPTLFLVIEAILDNMDRGKLSKSDLDACQTFLFKTYPLLRRHYLWYRKTQRGDITTFERKAFSNIEGYRWRGRTPKHILTSGLDDYPRAQPPHPGELHVDLMSWMGLLARSMKRIATKVKEVDDASEYSRHENAISRNIDDLHWFAERNMYCDATIDEYEEHVFVCHRGYVSLLPFMAGMVATDSPKMQHILSLIEELWADYGIRSLSPLDEHYKTGENYWTSPVWVNMNYLILQSLKTVALSKSPYRAQAQKFYTGLRRNVVKTVYESWKATGFAWEQYNPETGEGQRAQHFTGWTSLVIKMMCMPDLEGGVPTHGEL